MLWWTLRQLKSKDAKTRKRAAEKLGESGNAKVVEPLIAALKDFNKDVRQAAASALGEIGSAAVEPLIIALKGSDKDMRRNAAVLVKIGHASVEPLIAVLKDSIHKSVRRLAADALGEIGDVRAIEPLIAALNDPNHYIRQTAEGALRLIRMRQSHSSV